MTALIAPARVASKPMPFLLSDQFDALGQLGVVRDEDWDDLVELLSEKNADYIIVQTDQGPFMIVTRYPIDETP
jgi:hypothetical protein